MSGHGAHFDWTAMYLICFGVGLVLSVVALAGGFVHLHLGHLHVSGHGWGRGHARGALSPVNGFTVVAFLCWFGGTGYLLASGRVFAAALVALFSAVSGVAGAALVFWFLAKVMLPRERALEPADTPIVGVLGRVSAPVPAEGVGEMLYTQNGARRSMPIAAEDGVAIARDAEVVVLRYARGVAFVRRWDEMQQVLLGDAPMPHGADVPRD